MRADLIRLIHVARRELGLDEDTYRAALCSTVPGKHSCRAMSRAELERVLDAFRERGFKRRLKPALRAVKPASVPAKILAIWKTMHAQGFTVDGSESALNAWIMRQTESLNGGAGVAQVAWLNRDGEYASVVLESLKKWHMRCMSRQLNVESGRMTYNKVIIQYLAYLKRRGRNDTRSN